MVPRVQNAYQGGRHGLLGESLSNQQVVELEAFEFGFAYRAIALARGGASGGQCGYLTNGGRG